MEDPAKRKFQNPIALEINNGLDDSKIITTDTTGVIRNIFFNGKAAQKSIGIWSPEHTFDVKNISGDNGPEFIYLDKNQLYVYQPDSMLVYNYEFPYPISTRPQFFAEGLKYQIGVASSEDNLLYLFNEDGTLVKGFPFKGEPNFYVGNLKSDARRYLICGGKDNYLYVYRL